MFDCFLRETDRPTDSQTDRQTNRQTDRQTDRQRQRERVSPVEGKVGVTDPSYFQGMRRLAVVT